MGCFFFVVLMDWNMDSNSFGVDDSKNIPNWVWLVCSFCTFFAHLLDGTDGKQARRVGACGPTGELCIFFSINFNLKNLIYYYFFLI